MLWSRSTPPVAPPATRGASVRWAGKVQGERRRVDVQQARCPLGGAPVRLDCPRAGIRRARRLQGLSRALFGLLLLFAGAPQRQIRRDRGKGGVRTRDDLEADARARR